MTRSTLASRARSRPTQIAAAAVALTVAATITPAASPASATPGPALRLVRASPTAHLERYPDEGGFLSLGDLGVFLAAGDSPVEIWAKRASYRTPVTATITSGAGRQRTTRRLPAGLAGLDGLTDMLQVSVKNAKGTVIAKGSENFCPDNEYGAARTGPNSPATNPYPSLQCFYQHPFTLTALYGWQAGWASPFVAQETAIPQDAPDGTYTVAISVRPAWRTALGLSAAQGSTSVALKVTTVQDPFPNGGVGAASPARPGLSTAADGTGVNVPKQLRGRVDGTLATAGRDRLVRTDSPQVLSGPGELLNRSTVPNSVRPDLRSLPAYGVTVLSAEDAGGGTPGHEYLAFSATVWNAGPSPMVVDGFRRDGKPLMDAFQSFYDSSGRSKGYTGTGTLEYDARPGHEHWHFTDFATYRLLGANSTKIRSEKEAFCLAPTDAIDLSVKGAQWQPGQTGLQTACGAETALSIRETLHTGWGDTYGQYLPGQSFDITDLPNGAYDIQVLANPDGRLLETNTHNNESLRRIVLGGKTGARTVSVPPYQGIDAP